MIQQRREMAEFTSNDQSTTELKQNVQPSDWACKSFDGLVTLVLLVLNSGFVMSNTLNHQALLVLSEAFRRHGRIGQPPADEYCPNASYQA
jgi:hypothetical protein